MKRDGPGGRVYPFTDYDRESVTTILKNVPKEPLTNWTAKLVAERAVHKENTWHAIQKEHDTEAARKWVSAAGRDVRDTSGMFGSAVHHLCEHFDNLDDPDVESKFEWFIAQIELMMARAHEDVRDVRADVWRAYHHFASHLPSVDPWRRECVVYTDDYAGTCDLLAYKPSIGLGLVDYKTSRSIWPSHAAQASAYAKADTIAKDVNGVNVKDVSMPDICWCEIWHIRPDGLAVHEVDIEAGYRLFLAALEMRDALRRKCFLPEEGQSG